MTTAERRALVEPGHPRLSIRRQCELLGLSRGAYYYTPAPPDPEDLTLMRLLDEEYTRHPFFGVRRMRDWLADQGSQFTSEAYLDAVESAGVDVSMDGRGRWIDNRFIERLWRSVKYEDVYLNDYGDGLSADRGLRRWFGKYNELRPHQSLDNATPADWYRSAPSYGGKPATWEAMGPTARARRKLLLETGPVVESILGDDF